MSDLLQNDFPDRFITTRETSEITGLAEQTLHNHRHRGIGIPYIRVTNRAIRYAMSDVMAYMSARRIKTDNLWGDIE